jgi:hypothetical protein
MEQYVSTKKTGVPWSGIGHWHNPRCENNIIIIIQRLLTCPRMLICNLCTWIIYYNLVIVIFRLCCTTVINKIYHRATYGPELGSWDVSKENVIFLLHSSNWKSALTMEAARLSKTLTHSYKCTKCHFANDSNLMYVLMFSRRLNSIKSSQASSRVNSLKFTMSVLSYNSHRIDSEQAGSRYNNHRAKRLTLTTFYNF